MVGIFEDSRPKLDEASKSKYLCLVTVPCGFSFTVNGRAVFCLGTDQEPVSSAKSALLSSVSASRLCHGRGGMFLLFDTESAPISSTDPTPSIETIPSMVFTSSTEITNWSVRYVKDTPTPRKESLRKRRTQPTISLPSKKAAAKKPALNEASPARQTVPPAQAPTVSARTCTDMPLPHQASRLQTIYLLHVRTSPYRHQMPQVRTYLSKEQQQQRMSGSAARAASRLNKHSPNTKQSHSPRQPENLKTGVDIPASRPLMAVSGNSVVSGAARDISIVTENSSRYVNPASRKRPASPTAYISKR